MTMNEMLEKVCNGENSPAYELLNLIKNNNYIQATNIIKDYLKCDDNTAKIICMDFKTKVFDDLYISDLSPQEQAYNNAVEQELLNKPKCPTCQSTNVHKISGLESGASILTFGIFSKKINKTFKCGNCGMTF